MDIRPQSMYDRAIVETHEFVETRRKVVAAMFVNYPRGALGWESVYRPRNHLLYYQREGRRTMEDQEGPFEMVPGDLVLFFANREYMSYRPSAGYAAMNAQFEALPSDQSFAGSPPSAPGGKTGDTRPVRIPSKLRVSSGPRMEGLMERIVLSFHSTWDLQRRQTAVLLEELLLEMAIRSAPRPGHDQRIDYVIELLQRKLREKLDLDALAEAVGMSRRSLSRRFRRVTGRSVQQYHMVARLRQAAALLQSHPDVGLAAAAEALGFCDPFHFSRAFKREFGVTPSAFRRQAGGLGHTGTVTSG